MNEKKRVSIKARLLRAVMLIAGLALIITSIFGIYSMYNIRNMAQTALISQMEQNTTNIVSSKSDLADTELKNYADIVNDFAIYINRLYKNPDAFIGEEIYAPDEKNAGKLALQILPASKDTPKEAYQKEAMLLSSAQHIIHPVIDSSNDIITVVYIGSKNGFLIGYDKTSDMKTGIEEYPFFDTEWYKLGESSDGTAFTNVYDDGFGRGLTITCVCPYYDENDEFAGVIGMDILISNLYEKVVSMETDSGSVYDASEGAYPFLVDKAENVISPDASGVTLSDDEGMDDNVRAQIMSDGTGIALSDKGIYYAYSSIKQTDWHMCLRLPNEVILAPVDQMNSNIKNMMLVFILLFFAILVAMAVFITKSTNDFTKPIIALESDAKEIASGNLDHRAVVHNNDEVGDLAQSFNEMAKNLKTYIADLTKVTAEKERIGAELNVATKIQADMLPSIFPAFPDRTDIDIYASMDPAKEVGGDFYDLFMVDEGHLAVVMADVSGKGVPAALFMVIAKTLIKNHLQNKESVEDALIATNNQLCEGNDEMLFVTAWIGVVDLKSGHVEYCDAGHEFPIVLHTDGTVEEFHPTKKRPPLAAMEGMVYLKDTMDLCDGDKLFLYTDGVPEATDASGELYGMDRLKSCLEKHTADTPEQILVAVRADVDAFVGEADQFDDLTMLAFERKL